MPETVQIVLALLVEKLNAVNPLEALAVSVIGPTPNTNGVAGAKVTVWLAALMTTFALAEALA